MSPPAPESRTAAAGGAAEAAGRLHLFLDIARVFFRMRAAGKTRGLVTEWGGGAFGLMLSLRDGRPQTVPALARSRPVSRQRIQRLVDDLASDGLVEVTANPAHQRSGLVRLTPKGLRRLADLEARALRWSEELTADLDAGDLDRTQAILRTLAVRLGPDGPEPRAEERPHQPRGADRRRGAARGTAR